MIYVNSKIIDVFPLRSGVFGLDDKWFDELSSALIQPALFLLALMLVVSIGIMVLKRFEGVQLTRKLWNIPILILAVTLWPSLIIALKDLIDTFNTFLVYDVFKMKWNGFTFPEYEEYNNVLSWTFQSLARVLPLIAYWVMYAFFLIFFFFLAILGPLVLSKGILFDEIDTILELIKEITILLLWQTTIITLVGFIMPELVSGEPFQTDSAENYFLLIILGILMFFTPVFTAKFGNHLGSSLLTSGFRWSGGMIAVSQLGKLGFAGMSAAGISKTKLAQVNHWKDRILHAEEFKTRHVHRARINELQGKVHNFQHELGVEKAKHTGDIPDDQRAEDTDSSLTKKNVAKENSSKIMFNNRLRVDEKNQPFTPANKSDFLILSKKAKKELELYDE